MNRGNVKTWKAICSICSAKRRCLPAQRELCRILGHSMITVRRALFELEQVGVVKPVTGKGVFIRKDLTKQTNSGRILLLDINAPFREIDMGVRFLLQYVRKRGYEFRTVSCGEYPNDLTIREIEKASGLLVTGIITDCQYRHTGNSFRRCQDGLCGSHGIHQPGDPVFQITWLPEICLDQRSEVVYAFFSDA